jgi:hypothetical protein
MERRAGIYWLRLSGAIRVHRAKDRPTIVPS